MRNASSVIKKFGKASQTDGATTFAPVLRDAGNVIQTIKEKAMTCSISIAISSLMIKKRLILWEGGIGR